MVDAEVPQRTLEETRRNRLAEERPVGVRGGRILDLEVEHAVTEASYPPEVIDGPGMAADGGTTLCLTNDDAAHGNTNVTSPYDQNRSIGRHPAG